MNLKIDWDRYWKDLQAAVYRRNVGHMKEEQANKVYRELTQELIEQQLEELQNGRIKVEARTTP